MAELLYVISSQLTKFITMTYEEKKLLFDKQMEGINLKYTKELEKFEKKEKGSGDVNWHIVNNESMPNLKLGRVVNPSSELPLVIKNEVENIIKDIFGNK
jgi:ribosomal protein L1